MLPNTEIEIVLVYIGSQVVFAVSFLLALHSLYVWCARMLTMYTRTLANGAENNASEGAEKRKSRQLDFLFYSPGCLMSKYHSLNISSVVLPNALSIAM